MANGEGFLNVVRKLPLIDTYLRQGRLRKRYAVELDLMRGRHQHDNLHPSILHFSLNKAATQYTKRILKRCAAHNGLIPVGLHECAFNTGFPYLDQLSATEMRKYEHVFRRTGYLYSVFGGMIEAIPEFDQYRTVLMVRDPRDVLVSNYFSVAYSHPAPDSHSDKHAEFLENREAAGRMSIDEHVLAESDRVHGVLERYQKLLLDRFPETHVTRYEDMIASFETWLDRLLGHCELSISDELRESLIDENRRSRPIGENIQRHVRKGQPGDFRVKLQSETIRRLNTKFASTLETFGYEPTRPARIDEPTWGQGNHADSAL